MSGTRDAVVRRPGTVTAAVVVVVVAALVNAVIGGIVLSQLSVVRSAWLRSADRSAGPDPTVFIIAIAVVALLYAAALVVFAVLFRAGRPWARVALFGLTLLSLFALLPPSLPALAVVLLLVVADVLLYRAPVSAWVRSLRGLRAA